MLFSGCGLSLLSVLPQVFIESTLAQIYKEPVAKGGFTAAQHTIFGMVLNNKALSVLFAILIWGITYGWIYNSVQANTLAASLQVFNFDVSYTGAVVAILLGLIIFGGIHRVAKHLKSSFLSWRYYILLLHYSWLL